MKWRNWRAVEEGRRGMRWATWLDLEQLTRWDDGMIEVGEWYYVIHLCIHSGHLYSAPLRPLLFRGATDTIRILCQNFTPKPHRQLRVKDLPKFPTWRLERESNPWPFGRKPSTPPMRHPCPTLYSVRSSIHSQCSGLMTWAMRLCLRVFNDNTGLAFWIASFGLCLLLFGKRQLQ